MMGKFENKIPVIFAIDNDYVKPLSAVIISILKNSSKNTQFEFNVLSSCLSEDNKNILSSLKKFNKNISFNFINMREYTENLKLEKYMSRRKDYTYISVETYYRFYISELFPQHDKVLYLDADILVLEDIKELYDEDISEYYAGVVQDTVLEIYIEKPDEKTCTEPKRDFPTYFREKLKKKNLKYFNAGVLLFNLKKMREDNVAQKLWEFAEKESPLEYQDQDILNAVLEEKVKYVDYKWDVLKDLKWFAKQVRDEKKKKYLLKTYKHPGIFHYVGDNKPWILHDSSYNYGFIEKWWKYYKLSACFDEKDKQLFKEIKTKKLVPKIVKCVRIMNCLGWEF